MNRSTRTKKLTLHTESLRRLTRELREHELARALGGSDVGGSPKIATWPDPPEPSDTDLGAR
jgi:hypothetical protein